MSDLNLDLTPERPASTASVIDARHRRALVARIAGDRSGRYARSGEGGGDAFGAQTRGQAPNEGLVRAGALLPVSTGGVEDAALSLSDAFDPSVSVTVSVTAAKAFGQKPMQHANAVLPVAPASATVSVRRDEWAISDTLTSNESAASPRHVVAVRAGATAGATVGAAAGKATASPAAAPLMLADALVVPAGALVRGYLRCRSLLLAGDVVGNVHCTAGPVVIRAGAHLTGRIVASGDVYVCGTVADSGGGAVVSTRGKLTLAPGARIDGDVRSGRLDIYDGAMLAGVARACED
jgi:cytoskeletal protein CcmA (bactofilin family)